MFWVFSLTPNSEIPDSARKVPTLTGESYDAAQDALLDLDLAATKAEEASATVPQDQVIRTDPPAGTIVQPAEVIKVFVSTGAEPVEVPDVTNQTVEEAEAAITEAGFVSGSVTKENSPTVAEGVVMRSDPVAASMGEEGGTINLVVSSGLVTLADVTGQSLSAATDLLSAPDVQLVPIPAPDYSCFSESGSPVTRQSVAPGDVPQKSEVTLTYCAG